MKLMIKLCVFVLVLGVAGLFVLKRPDGRPWLTLNDVQKNLLQTSHGVNDQLDKAKQAIKRWVPSELVSSSHSSKPQTVYRWRRSDGSWMLSDQPPQDQSYEEIQVDSARNVIQATAPVRQAQPSSQPLSEKNPTFKLDETIQQARGLQQRIDKRDNKLQQY